ncbi:response regulator transcription factor [Algibacillus agarilyticus]|uniref:response regulator transcription factor n=1 Tax=Algibacillus agarilyticus TaxID=2234133 RepID=UPI000DD0CA16|nr:response regulator [Algibacillus agarilyticus]
MRLNTGEILRREQSILIVDDARLMRDFLRNMLTELGFSRFIEAETKAETLRKFENEKPDIVFLDIELEEDNGLDILQLLRKMDEDSKIAIVSAHSTIVNVRKAMDLGAKGFMVKPYKPKKLISTLRNMGVNIA